MDKDKSTMASWVAWVAVIIGVIALIMAWVAMDNVSTLREEVGLSEQIQPESEIMPPPVEDPMNDTEEGTVDGSESPDATMPEGDENTAPIQ